MKINGDGFLLRPFQIEDKKALAKHANNEINNEAAGAIEFWPGEDVYRLNAEIGYWLGEEHWGKGIMTAVIKAMVQYIFEYFEVKRIYALPFASTTGSIRALEKAGFSKEASIKNGVIKSGRVLDYHIYSIASF